LLEKRKEFVIIYTTGDHLIEENGVIRVSLSRAWIDFQFDSPLGPRYTTVSNNTKVDIELKKGYYSQPASAQYLYVNTKEERLKKGDKVYIKYGDRSKGGPVSQVQAVPQEYFKNDEIWWASPSRCFLTFVDPYGSGNFKTLGDNYLWTRKIVAGRPVKLFVTVPFICVI